MSWFEAEKLAFKLAPTKALRVPGTSHTLDVDWKKVEDEYVWGDEVKQDGEGNFVRVYPTMSQLAQKYGTSMALVGKRAKRGDWLKRREECKDRVREEYEKQADEQRAKARAGQRHEAIDVIERWIGKFAEALEAGVIKPSSMSDLNIALRLRAFLKGEAESRSEQKVVHSLEELTSRHLRQRGRVALADGELGGVLALGEGEQATDGDVLEARAEVLPEGEVSAA